MQWNSTPLSGFATGQPWLPIAPDHTILNVAAQERDAHSTALRPAECLILNT